MNDSIIIFKDKTKKLNECILFALCTSKLKRKGNSRHRSFLSFNVQRKTSVFWLVIFHGASPHRVKRDAFIASTKFKTHRKAKQS